MTILNPKIIPKITAPTEPITVKNPFTPHAHGIKEVDSLLTVFMPVGNGIPNKIPMGHISNNVMQILAIKFH